MRNQFAKNITYLRALIFFNLLMSFTLCANEDLIEKLDQNQDGLISIKESVADPNLLAIFGSIDRNFDGFITKLELEQFAKIINDLQMASN
jgi:Ca2+-binding EF-hand superfamily protein